MSRYAGGTSATSGRMLTIETDEKLERQSMTRRISGASAHA
jgi:hypothetical protein